MLRNKLLPSLLLLIACSSAADDKADTSYDAALRASSGLKARAEAVSKKALQALRGTSDEGSGHSNPENAKTIDPHLIEIGGVAGHLFATFDMGDGIQAEFGPGQSVPKWGRILTINPSAVERDDHRFFLPED